MFISIKKWFQSNYLGPAPQLTSNSNARLHFDALSLLRPLPKSGPLYNIKKNEVSDDGSKREYYGMYMFVINWMFKQ